MVDLELRRASCRATAATRSRLQFLNYWNVNANGGWRQRVLDDRLTRGGPSASRPAAAFWNVNGGTDSRKAFSLSGNGNYNWTDDGGWSRNGGVIVQPQAVAE